MDAEEVLHKLPHHHGEEPLDNVLEELFEPRDFSAAAEVFHQLGDPTRVQIFWLLCHKEECVINLAAMLGKSSPAVAHHLRSLRDSGLLVSRREGKEVFYRAVNNETGRLLHHMIEQVMEITCPEEPEE